MLTTEESARYLRRYQRWRRGEDERTFEEAGLDPKQIGEALDAVLSAVTTLRAGNASLQARLAKCQVQRERIHFELRRKKHPPVPPDRADS